MTWAVSTKGGCAGEDGRLFDSYEVCAEEIPHTPSWGWFGRNKIRIEGMPFEEAKKRAQIICDALNAVDAAGKP